MSQIKGVYTALAGLSAVVDGETVDEVYDLPDLPTQVHSVNLPLRLLLPFRDESQSGTVVTLGRRWSMEWRIVDLFLWKPVTQGRGLAAVPYLYDYIASYLENLKLVNWPENVTLVSIPTCEPGTYGYPTGTAAEYFGVEIVLGFKELI